MFTYNEFVIKSSVPLSDIASYFREVGAVEKAELAYEYCTGGSEPLEITITIGVNEALKMLNVPMHTIRVSGNERAAKDFLDGFRLKFLSAGG